MLIARRRIAYSTSRRSFSTAASLQNVRDDITRNLEAVKSLSDKNYMKRRSHWQALETIRQTLEPWCKIKETVLYANDEFAIQPIESSITKDLWLPFCVRTGAMFQHSDASRLSWRFKESDNVGGVFRNTLSVLMPNGEDFCWILDSIEHQRETQSMLMMSVGGKNDSDRFSLYPDADNALGPKLLQLYKARRALPLQPGLFTQAELTKTQISKNQTTTFYANGLFVTKLLRQCGFQVALKEGFVSPAHLEVKYKGHSFGIRKGTSSPHASGWRIECKKVKESGAGSIPFMPSDFDVFVVAGPGKDKNWADFGWIVPMSDLVAHNIVHPDGASGKNRMGLFRPAILPRPTEYDWTRDCVVNFQDVDSVRARLETIFDEIINARESKSCHVGNLDNV